MTLLDVTSVYIHESGTIQQQQPFLLHRSVNPAGNWTRWQATQVLRKNGATLWLQVRTQGAI